MVNALVTLVDQDRDETAPQASKSVRTNSQGDFEITGFCVASPPECALSIRAHRYVPLQRTWRIERLERYTVALGNIVLERGTHVDGMAKETDGSVFTTERGGVVTLRRLDLPPGPDTRLAPPNQVSALLDETGKFEFEDRVAAGNYGVEVE